MSDALANSVGLSGRIADLGTSPELHAEAVVDELPASIKTIHRALQEEAQFRSDALAAGEAVRRSDVRQMLAEMPIEKSRR